MYDSMIIVAQARQWQNARFVALPMEPHHPVVWIDHEGLMCMYHPALVGTPGQKRRVNIEWDQPNFDRVARQMQEQATFLIRQRMELTPSGYYSQFPKILRSLAMGDNSFTEPYTSEKQANKRR